MSCTCIKEIPNKVMEHCNSRKDFEKTPVISAQFKDIVFPIDKNGEMTTALKTDIKLTCQNRKTPKTQQLRFTFCPFCGEKYD